MWKSRFRGAKLRFFLVFAIFCMMKMHKNMMMQKYIEKSFGG
jgi:hypothetical protein